MEEGFTDWIQSLKEGDKVAVIGKFGEKGIETIERFTNTLIATKCSRYWKKDGFQVGADIWARKHIKKLTQEFIDEIHLRRQSRYLTDLFNKTSVKDLGIEKIEKIIVLIERKPLDFASQPANAGIIIADKSKSAKIDITKNIVAD